MRRRRTPPRQAEIDQREGQVDQHDDDADRGAAAELEMLEGQLVGVDRQDLGAEGRAAAGQQERREHVEGPHRHQDQVGHDMAADQRQGDVAQLLPGRGADHVGGLEIARRDRLQRRGEQHHREGGAAPGVEHDDGQERHLQQPVRPRQAERAEDAVQRAGVAIEIGEPGEADHHLRQDPGRHHRRLHRGLQGRMDVLQQPGQQQAQQRLADQGREQHELDGQDQRGAELAGGEERAGVEQRGVVLQPDEIGMQRGAAQQGAVGEADRDDPKERDDDEQPHQHSGRHHERGPGPGGEQGGAVHRRACRWASVTTDHPHTSWRAP